MVIAIDFDGTLVTNNFPNIGIPIKGSFETVKTMIKNGHQCFLYTMRGHSEADYTGRDLLNEAYEFCKSQGVDFKEYINKSYIEFKGNDSPKPYADLYIDDSAICSPLNAQGAYENAWKTIGLHLIYRDIITKKQYNDIWNEVNSCVK